MASNENYRLPTQQALEHATKIAVVEDKQIMMDYWTLSLDKKIIIGVRDDGEKLLVKSEDEYTSPITKIYNVGSNDYLIMTENSIYLVDKGCPTSRIS